VDRATSKMTGFDLKHCKGCGICAQVCPVKPNKAITMMKEEK
jgi:Pyruvate/2-oxoacid:ferredoxin oxidoreductase delta subunit